MMAATEAMERPSSRAAVALVAAED